MIIHCQKSIRDFGVENGSWGVLTKRQRELVREEGGGEERPYIVLFPAKRQEYFGRHLG